MEIVNNNIFTFIHSQGLFFALYVYFILILLIAELVSLFYINYYIIKLDNNINTKSINKDPFLDNLIINYKELLDRQYDIINTRSFIEGYFSKYSKIRFYLINLIENSGFFFLFLGLLGAFIIMLSAIITINFEGLAGFQGLYSRLEGIIYSLKPALFFLIVGIISSIIINIFTKLFDISSRFEKIKIRLENYLENNLKYKYNRDLKHINLIEKLIKAINNNFMSLEDVIEDSINDSFCELIETFTNYMQDKDFNKITEANIKREIASTHEDTKKENNS